MLKKIIDLLIKIAVMISVLTVVSYWCVESGVCLDTQVTWVQIRLMLMDFFRT